MTTPNNPTPPTKQNNAKLVLFVGIMTYITILSIIIFLMVIDGFERSIPLVSGVYAGFGVLVGVLYKVFSDVGEKLNIISKQTNGTLSKLREELSQMTALYVASQQKLAKIESERKRAK